ncbi:response regulator [Neisseria sp.]|uniref:response regulator n=1 Tax=Neisseria sp. TaxID=192066 RepID=UPI0035A09F0B
MNKHILVIDDEKLQAEALARQLNDRMYNSGYKFEPLHSESEINNAINDRFCSLAIIDLRMDDYEFNGIDLYHRIIKNNPLAKVILVSAWLPEFTNSLKDIFLSGNVLQVMEKESMEIWVPKIQGIIENFFNRQEEGLSENSRMLMNAYIRAKNEENSQKKGMLFEEFLTNLFGQIGFHFIQKRVTDSTSEVDLILRNDINDKFLEKFGKYILVEAKNRPSSPVNKSDFVSFKAKLDSTNQLAELGIIASSYSIAGTVRLEALRTSREAGKILLFANNELINLITADDKQYAFKKLIDEQIKDVPY